MSNGISQRQTQRHCIYMLAAQRQLYNEVRTIRYLVVIFEVLLPFIMSLIQSFFKTDYLINNLYYTISIIGLFIGILFMRPLKEKQSKAALIQQLFDTYTYQMPWSRQLFGDEIAMDALIAEKSQKYFAHGNNEDGLHHWYLSAADEVPLEKGILLCQRQNIYWDSRLKYRYKNACIVMITGMLLTILGIGIVQNEKMQEFLCRSAFLAPLLHWIFSTTTALNFDMAMLETIKNKTAQDHLRTMDELQDIQKDIFAYRSSCCIIPQWIYKLFKNQDESFFQTAVEITNSHHDNTDRS